MRPTCDRLLLAAACVVCWAAAGADAAEVRVEGWSASYSSSDTFDDGILLDGDPDEVLRYEAPCGNLDDGAEAAGRLRLAGPSAQCDGSVIAMPHVLLGRDYRVRVVFRPVVLLPDASLGITLFTPDFAERRDLLLQRGALLGPGSDAVGLTLFANRTIVLERTLLSTSTNEFFGATPTIELELWASEFGNGPRGSYRRCPAAGCAASVPFVPLEFLMNGAIPVPEKLYMSFGAYSPAPFAVDILEWHLESSLVDTFYGAFGERMPYTTRCFEPSIVWDALVAATDEACGHATATPAIEVPGEASVQATFAWPHVTHCADGPGIALAADPFVTPTPDTAEVYLRRGPLPGVGSDVLFAVLETELAGPAQAWLELAVLSTTPSSPPAGVDSIEFLLETRRATPGAPLLPHAMFRTCAGTNCSNEFQDLQPYSFPQDDPGVRFCGDAAADFVSPSDGGRLNPEAALVPHLLLAPEPEADAAGLLALAAVAFTATRGSRRRGSRAAPTVRGAGCRRGEAGSSRRSR